MIGTLIFIKTCVGEYGDYPIRLIGRNIHIAAETNFYGIRGDTLVAP